MVHQWVYRPTEKEHEMLMRALSESQEFSSVAQIVRESVLRFVHGSDRKPLYIQVSTLIDELQETKAKFLNLVLRHSEEP
jgi:hypothetical protein